ncbi:uncharacterized protein LOC130658036 [Hydractinia symbiolongicarpus]|uniref:uncharacterized protein LOC130658036 n=1 Tax=Hydractinia symbiolongicarpus TaxID=13093 RepID=UPI00254DCE40|nr:uncharacterized protein LOC130658036 [Hydractinia symbiolongicarpus]
MEEISAHNCVTIKIKNFLSTWWVSKVLNFNQKIPAEERGNNVDDGDSDDVVKKYALKVNVHLLLKWIRGEIYLHEKSSNKEDNLKKIILFIETEEDLIHMIALTAEFYRIMKETSDKPDLKKELQEKETFSEEEPYWPNRWVVHIEWKFNKIPPKMWHLRNVEKLDLSLTYDESRRQDEGKFKKRTSLPHYIGVFRELKHLNLEGNAYDSLPSTLRLCQKLEVLKLFNNKFQALPLFLLHMPNLKVLSRHDNKFDFNIDHPWQQKLVKGNNDTQDMHVRSCMSLRMCSAVSVVKSLHVSNVDNFDLLGVPHTLVKILFDALNIVNCCDHCGKGVLREESWRYQNVIDSLFGYNHIPLCGFACSHECAVNAKESFSMKNEAYLKKNQAANVYVYDIKIEDWVGDHSYKFRKRHNGRFMRTMRRMKRLFTC